MFGIALVNIDFFARITTGAVLESYSLFALMFGMVSVDSSAPLTAYLLQGLLMSWVFSGYGLGLVGKLSVAAYVPIGAAAALASLLFVGVWRKRYEWAPVEMLLRRWVYLGRRAPPA